MKALTEKGRSLWIPGPMAYVIAMLFLGALGARGEDGSGNSRISAYPLKDLPERGAVSVPTKASSYKYSGTNVSIPDAGSWVSSPITVSDAPSGATVTGIDVYFRCVHPYAGDLNIDLNADPQGTLGNVDRGNGRAVALTTRPGPRTEYPRSTGFRRIVRGISTPKTRSRSTAGTLTNGGFASTTRTTCRIWSPKICR